MVGVLEAGLVVGALGLDIYAYKKMKDAEAAAENAVRDRERTRFKTEAASVQVDVHPEAAPAGAGTQNDTHTQTALADHGNDEHTTTQTEWKPVTYESVAPVEAHEETITTVTTTSVDADEIKKQYRTISDRLDAIDERSGTLDADEVKKQYQTIAERLDVIDERLHDQDSKISVMETKFEHAESEVEKSTKQVQSVEEQWRQVDEQLKTIDEQLRNVEIPAEQIEVLIDKRYTKSNDRLVAQVKENQKKITEVQSKLDSHVIAAADPVLIKRDLRDEFYPLLKAPQAALETHEKDNKAAFASLSKRITQARDATLAEIQTKASKVEVRRIVATIKARPVAKSAKVRTVTVKKTVKTQAQKPARAPFNRTTAKKTVKTSKKTTTKKTAVKTKTSAKPKSKIQSAVHEFAKTRKTKKTASSGEVTVTTSVPKGVNVSTEVVTGGKAN